MKIMTGIDLHSNNAVCGMLNMEGERIFQKRLPCDLPRILQALAPYKQNIDTIAVESTYNWYWLVDGLQDHGYKVVLANPCKIQQYNGIKHADDTTDAFFLAELLRLGVLPCGYIYDRTMRSVRDLLRRRLGLVQMRSGLLISFKSLHTRMSGQTMNLAKVKRMTPEEGQKLFQDPCDQLLAGEQIELIKRLGESIRRMESSVEKIANETSYYQRLKSIPGIGKILGLTITMEVGQIDRFIGPGEFASYCRCVKSQRLSNGKKKGDNNAKCGNQYLSWAFVEASNISRQHNIQCQRFYERKKAQANSILATKALACKLAKAAWHVMRYNQDFDPERAFGPIKKVRILAEHPENPNQ